MKPVPAAVHRGCGTGSGSGRARARATTDGQPTIDAGSWFRLRKTPHQAATRLVQEYGLAERADELVYGRLQDHPEGDSRHEHWRQVMAIVQKTRRRKMERRHLLR
jgi:hypothetical protein